MRHEMNHRLLLSHLSHSLILLGFSRENETAPKPLKILENPKDDPNREASSVSWKTTSKALIIPYLGQFWTEVARNMNLAEKKCVPCEGGTPPLTETEINHNRPHVPGWIVVHNKTLTKEYTFSNFVKAIAFVDAVADIAELESHHPDIHISYNKVSLELWTHAIGGLSENDFIVAAKINALRPR